MIGNEIPEQVLSLPECLWRQEPSAFEQDVGERCHEEGLLTTAGAKGQTAEDSVENVSPRLGSKLKTWRDS